MAQCAACGHTLAETDRECPKCQQPRVSVTSASQAEGFEERFEAIQRRDTGHPLLYLALVVMVAFAYLKFGRSTPPPPAPPPAPVALPAPPPQLPPAVQKGPEWILEGQAYDVLTRRPVPGAELDFKSKGKKGWMKDVGTDSNGRFRIALPVDPAGYVLHAARAGYRSTVYPNIPNSSQESTLRYNVPMVREGKN